MFRFTIRDLLAVMATVGIGLSTVSALDRFGSDITVAISVSASVAIIGSVVYLRCLRPEKGRWPEIAVGVIVSLVIVAAFVVYESLFSQTIYLPPPSSNT
jgi:hypothetical protein